MPNLGKTLAHPRFRNNLLIAVLIVVTPATAIMLIGAINIK